MIVRCPHCDTVGGRECTNTFRGPRAKPRWQSVCGSHHVEAFGRCDVCSLTAKAIRKNYVVEWDSAEVPGWVDLATGRMVRQYDDEWIAKTYPPAELTQWGEEDRRRREEQHVKTREERRAAMQPHKIHVCPECAASLREAQTIAFDLCLSKREGLNAGRQAA
jgi:hypothetical protein